MAKKKYYIHPGPPPRRFRTFVNDKDGLSARDYLLIISTLVFFLFISIGLTLVLFDKEIDSMYLDLLEMVVPVLMTVVGGVMGVQAVETFSNRDRKKKKEPEEVEYEYIEEDGYHGP